MQTLVSLPCSHSRKGVTGPHQPSASIHCYPISPWRSSYVDGKKIFPPLVSSALHPTTGTMSSLPEPRRGDERNRSQSYHSQTPTYSVNHASRSHKRAHPPSPSHILTLTIEHIQSLPAQKYSEFIIDCTHFWHIQTLTQALSDLSLVVFLSLSHTHTHLSWHREETLNSGFVPDAFSLALHGEANTLLRSWLPKAPLCASTHPAIPKGLFPSCQGPKCTTLKLEETTGTVF
jgi:hypothetical protein